jgi:hypothetical protein
MNYQWLGLSELMAIVEFHDIRAEKHKSDKYLGLVEGPLAAPFAGAGGALMGQFRVEGHPDRLVLMRGYPSMLARRKTLAAFHGGPDWQRHRAEATGLVRDASVILTRSLAASSATRPLRTGDSYTAIVSELRFAEQLGNYHLWLRLMLRKAGFDPLAAFATLESVNDVPSVPVVRNKTHHIALVPQTGNVPQLPPELRDMLRYPAEILSLSPAPALVW